MGFKTDNLQKGRLWDLAVIGGGPAGMMAAGRAAELGAKVILIEKNSSLGKKLLITGGGRCNLTNAELDTRKFLSKFKKNDKFLFSAFAQHGVKETLDFFRSKNMPVKIEMEKRAFPASDSASSVWNTLVNYMKKGGVAILSDSPVAGFIRKGDRIEAIKIKNNGEIRARSFVLATGGKSRPETGSTGDGFGWLKNLGHTVAEPNAALVPVSIKNGWVKRLRGVSLPEAKLAIFQNNERQGEAKGKILFTHFGISGPLVLNLSKDIGEYLKYGEVTLSLDLFPLLDQGALDKKMTAILAGQSNRQFKNLLGPLAPAALAPILMELSCIRPDTPGHSVTREQRLKFVKLLKNIPMQVAGLLGANKAVVTSGGVALEEVNFKTMQSRKIPNLYLVGDILNIDRPSGGYSLQLCWTTGFVAGTSAAKSE